MYGASSDAPRKGPAPVCSGAVAPRVRTATPDDVPAIVALLDAAYGANPTFEARFRAYRSLEPEGWVVVEGGASQLVGVGGFVSFGTCAYLGLMAVPPEAQRRGIGAAVFEEVLRRCDARGCTLLLLDASDAGAPLYEKYAFRDHGIAQAYSLEPRAFASDAPPSIDVRPLDPTDARLEAEVARFDAVAYGADRSSLVRHYSRSVERGRPVMRTFTVTETVTPAFRSVWIVRDPRP